MLDLLEGVLALLPAFETLAVLALRSAALVALGWLVAVLLKRSLPAARQALWTAVVVGLVMLPILSAGLPAWDVLPAHLASGLSVESPRTPRAAGQGAAGSGSQGSVSRDSVAALPAATVTSGGLEPHSEGSVGPDWKGWMVLLWAGGALAAALTFVAGLWRLRRVRRSGSPASPGLRRQATRLAGRLGVRRQIRVLISSQVPSPATWGLRRPVILLPPISVQWSAERCRLVLAHEIEHVARGDWAWRLLAEVGCVAYWFNPLAWIAARRLRFEQELACDLAVVEGGALPSLYAHHLLNIARAAAGGRALPLVALDMARRSQMEGRLMSILADRPARGLRRGLLVPALSILAALPVLAAVQPEAPPAPEAPAVAPAVAPEPVPADTPAPSAAPSPTAAPVGGAQPVPAVSVASAPVVAPSAVPAPRPVLAPTPGSDPDSIYGVLAASQVVAPDAPAPADGVAADAPAAPGLAPMNRARAEALEARIAAKAAEIEALVGPIHEEIERATEGDMALMLEQMELLEVEMRPIQEEMSRIGEEMSLRMMETMPAQLEMEEFARRAEALALEMEQRSRLTEDLVAAGEPDREALGKAVREMNEALAPLRGQLGELQRQMQDRHLAMADLHELMEPYRARMEALRESMAPQRERMEELRRQFEPRREEIERVREERMAEVRERMDALRAELELLTEEMRRE